ncbi:MAG: serine hydroxymethyltransferase [Phycisphaerales bacterium]|nr:MAG: serine hydroxymethyltransferase [Phycisphaerales bacterium]
MTTATSTNLIPETLDPIARNFLELLWKRDPEAASIFADEAERQATTLEMIASENHCTPTVMHAMGTWMTDKYAEGYPRKRYYSGCVNYDRAEQLAIDRACELFGCKYANVQPHSGANANLAVYFALLQPGDTFMSVVLSDGGHLTHGSPVALPGKWLNPVHYPLVYDELRDDYGFIDYDAVAKMAAEHKPKIILCGYSAYPRIIDFAKFREIADSIDALMVADIAHIAGLVAGGAHPSPFPHAHIVTTTTHKTLRGPRGGLILTNDEELSKAINKAVFPGTQGGPLMHMVAAKAVAFAEAMQPDFKQYAKQVVANAKVLAAEFMDRGYHLVSRGTDNHLMLMDLRKFDPELTGKQAAIWLEDSGIICNKNTVAQEERSPFQTSGLRFGTPALTTRGFKEKDMHGVAELIDRVLKAKGDEAVIKQVRGEVRELCKGFPLPH